MPTSLFSADFRAVMDRGAKPSGPSASLFPSPIDWRDQWIYFLMVDPTATASPVFNTVFVTSNDFDGNLGGQTGADADCAAAATGAGLSGTFKALALYLDTQRRGQAGHSARLRPHRRPAFRRPGRRHSGRTHTQPAGHR
ncbi:MAG: hypothetical protein WBQ86_21020 [Candidatus Binatus sp.]